MKTVTRFLILFLLLTLIAVVAERYFNAPFGNANYWDHHGIFFLIFLTMFPRLTLLFSSVVSGGLLLWLAWLVVPRFLVAILATVSYWNQNPILVTLSWLIAIGAESSEKYVVIRRVRTTSPIYHPRQTRHMPRDDVIDITPDSSSREDT